MAAHAPLWQHPRMRTLFAAVTLATTPLALAASAWAKDPAPTPAKPATAIVRDLTALPTGTYRMIQAWDSKGTETSEHGAGEKADTKAIASSNRFTFTVGVKDTGTSPSTREIGVVVKRIEMKTDDVTDAPLAYDSAGPAEKQSDLLYTQFHALVGASARVGAAAFSDGEGFRGFDAVWKTFAEAHPEMSRAARANLGNYGDARLDRMFAQGLDALFGAEAGRAKGRSREVRVGDEFTSSVERAGIAMKPTTVDLECKVISIARGEVVVRSEWKINGLDPTTDGGGLSVRGADVHGVATLTFLAPSGLLTRLEETLERTDQVAPGSRGVTQWTRRVTEHRTFSFVKE